MLFRVVVTAPHGTGGTRRWQMSHSGHRKKLLWERGHGGPQDVPRVGAEPPPEGVVTERENRMCPKSPTLMPKLT